MQNTTFKDLPSVNQVMHRLSDCISLDTNYIKHLIQSELELLRAEITKNKLSKSRAQILEYLIQKVLMRTSPNMVNLINGTGIVLHTGFGRAPFEAKKFREIAKHINGYVNLEFDLESGKRGDRQSHVREHISSICQSESSLVVNNNAAAVVLSINSLAESGEVIVSRGQLVEIGGSFRIPDIIEKSGAIIKEVGTTNRTNLNDYEKAINNKTKLILYVHTSNYTINGYTQSVPIKSLVKLGRKYDIPVMVDWGSGSFIDMKAINIAKENPISIIMKNKPDLLTFSGDKLVGGPQAGIIVGKKILIDLFQRNQLYRVLRIDKINLCFLEHTLRTYRSSYQHSDNLSIKLLTTSRSILKNRARKIFKHQTNKKVEELGISIVDTEVEAGSGSLPENKIKSAALAFSPRKRKVKELAHSFRCHSTPIVGYINGNVFFLDMKAVLPSQISILSKAIQEV